MKYFQSLIGVLLAVILASCVPTRYSWSPDGRWMTVISDDGLHIADADGNLLPGALSGVDMATWFPDSAHVAVCREIDVASWNELAKYVSPADVQTISAISSRLSDFAKGYDWTAKNADSWKALEAAWTKQEQPAERVEEERHSELGTAIAMYLRDHADQSFRQKIPPARRMELTTLKQQVRSLEVCAITPAGPGAGRQLMTSLRAFHDLRVSPTGAAVLVTTEGSDAHDSDLLVVPADGSHPSLQLSDRAAWYADWSPDGRDALFIHANLPAVKDEARLASLTRARVVDDRGAVVDKAPAGENLLGLIYSDLDRVRCLQNGNILFAGTQVQLPFVRGDVPDRPAVFSFNPSQPTAVLPILTKQALEVVGDAAQYFEVSPDGQHLSIPDKSGKVYVVDLHNGAVTLTQSNTVITGENKPELLTIPQWRTNDELTFIAPGQDNQPSVQLFSISKNSSKTLSAKWPGNLIGKKLDAPAADQPPGGL
jgi:Tol biopolymer transport system component